MWLLGSKTTIGRHECSSSRPYLCVPRRPGEFLVYFHVPGSQAAWAIQLSSREQATGNWRRRRIGGGIICDHRAELTLRQWRPALSDRSGGGVRLPCQAKAVAAKHPATSAGTHAANHRRALRLKRRSAWKGGALFTARPCRLLKINAMRRRRDFYGSPETGSCQDVRLWQVLPTSLFRW